VKRGRQLELLLGGVLLAASGARGDETRVRLHEATELVSVRASCSGCHSLDYIEMNAPFLKRAGWEAEVRKMMKAYGAPVPEPDVAAIVDYLTRYYGGE
jgi:sulfite dehydrogenase (cytochrome) subunit B